MKLLYRIIATLFFVFLAFSVRALPLLQLDILGGTYDTSTETIMAPGNSFSVYAYGLSGSGGIALTDNFFLSMALVPIISTAGAYGSFTVNGTTTINVTSDMTYGVPPLETVLGGADVDPGDLPKHDIFPTYFAETSFKFSSSNQSGLYTPRTTPAGDLSTVRGCTTRNSISTSLASSWVTGSISISITRA